MGFVACSGDQTRNISQGVCQGFLSSRKSHVVHECTKDWAVAFGLCRASGGQCVKGLKFSGVCFRDSGGLWFGGQGLESGLCVASLGFRLQGRLFCDESFALA